MALKSVNSATPVRTTFMTLICAGAAILCSYLALTNWPRLAMSFEQARSNLESPLALFTLAITTMLLMLGALAFAWWALGYFLASLASLAPSGSTWHHRLVDATALVAPRLARKTLVTVASASLVLGATPALAVDSDQTASAPAGTHSVYLGFGAGPEFESPSIPDHNPDQTPAQAPTEEPAKVPAQAPAQAEALAPPQATAPAPTQGPAKAPIQAPTQMETQVPPQTETPGAPSTVTVSSGDCLWSITAALHPHASSQQIAHLWPLLYQANRDKIGSNPDLLLPGTTLQIPSALVPAS